MAAGVLESGAAEPKAPITDCRAKWGQVIVHAGPKHDGRCVVKGPGIYPNTAAIGLGSPMRSLRLEGFTDAVVCRRGPIFLEVECDKVVVSLRGLSDRPDAAWTWLQVVDSNVDRAKAHLECLPADDEVTLSARRDGLGPCIRRKQGAYPTPQAMGVIPVDRHDVLKALPAPVRLDTASRTFVLAGKKIQGWFCERENWGCVAVRPSESSFRKEIKPGTARLYADCQPSRDQVAIFAHREGVGPCRTLGPGDFSEDQLKFGDQGVATIRMHHFPDVAVTTCDAAGPQGQCATWQGNRTFSDPPRWMRIFVKPKPAPASAVPADAEGSAASGAR